MRVGRPGRGTRTKRVAGALLVVGAVACGGNSQGAGRGGFVMPPAEVGVVTATPHAVPTPYEFVGQVEPYRRVEVRSRVEGIIEERPFIEGSVVHRGDLLYRLDTVRYAAAYQSAPRHLRQRHPHARAVGAAAAAARGGPAGRGQRAHRRRRRQGGARPGQEGPERHRDRAPRSPGASGARSSRSGARVTGSADLLTTIDRSRSGVRDLPPVVAAGARLAREPARPRAHRAGQQTGRAGRAARRLAAPGRRAPRLRRAGARFGHRHAGVPCRRSPNADGCWCPGEFVHVRLDRVRASQRGHGPAARGAAGLGRQFVYVVGAGDSVSARDVTPGPWTGHEWIIDSRARGR